MPTHRQDLMQSLEIVAGGDRHDMEALQLEIRRLAREHGVEIVSVEIVPTVRRRKRRRVSARRRPAQRPRG